MRLVFYLWAIARLFKNSTTTQCKKNTGTTENTDPIFHGK